MKEKRHGRGRRALMGLILAIVTLLALYAGVVAMVWWRETHVPPAEEYDAIIVLGAQVKPDGKPSVQLKWRLDTALEAWRQRPVVIVTCGAQGGDEPAPEGDVMRAYLIDAGVPAEDVLAETASFNTRQNIRHAAALLAERQAEKVLIVTSDYHLPRAMALARDEGLEATGIGSPTRQGLYFWLKNHGREALSWLKYWGQKYLRLPME